MSRRAKYPYKDERMMSVSKPAARLLSARPGAHLRYLFAALLPALFGLSGPAPAADEARVAVQTGTGADQNGKSPEKSTEKTPAPLLTRAEILSSDADRLERIGRHVIIGFHAFAEVKALVDKRAIGGIFITDHNVRHRNAAQVKAEIDALQARRREQGLPPLVVAADQEGGTVSRLSPPLKRQPTLASVLAKLEHDAERKTAVEDYARRQAAELTRIGVTLNFAPVVDLKLELPNRNDGETRLRWRAISADPYTVAKVAGWYCDTLADVNLMCTLKHFPGLGRVTRDTHVSMAEVTASEGTLELNDWVPFRRVMSKPNVVTMLGHVRVGVIDRETPASYSAPVIKTLMRETWNYDGLIVTDDLSMGAITKSRSGAGGAAVKSLNAGTDFVLVSYSEKDLDVVLSALIAADAAGELDRSAREKSRSRIDRAMVPQSLAGSRD